MKKSDVIVESLANDYDVLAIAAAAVKMAHESKATDVSEVDIVVAAVPVETPRKRTSRRTEEAYVGWLRRCVRFHAMQHPRAPTPSHVRSFLSHCRFNGR